MQKSPDTSLVDTHCHLDLAVFDPDRRELLTRAGANGVKAFVVPGIQAASWEALLRLCASDERLHPALGLHPMFMQQHQPRDLLRLRELLEQHPVVALGEIGLDFYHGDEEREQQFFYLQGQFELAAEFSLPVLLHVRKAHDEVLQQLKRYGVNKGIVHAYGGSEQQAQHYLKQGLLLGIGGMVTYERSRKLRKLVAQLPLEAMVLETDAPDMSPAGHHGERNSPEYLPEILQVIAELHNEKPQHVAAVFRDNVKTLLGI